MKARAIIPVAILLAAALAGCTTNETTTTTTSTPSTTSTTTTTTTTPTPSLRAIKVGTEAAYPPFEDTLTGGEIVGFDIEVMVEIGNRSLLAPTFQNAEFTAIIPSIQSGQFDAGISAFTITDERKQSVDFTVAYYDNELMVGVRADDTTIKTEADLVGHKVCTQTGTTSETWLLEHAQADGDITRFSAFPPCADALKRGDVDAMMIDRAVVRTLITNSNGELKEAFVISTDEQFGIAVSKDNKDLLTAMNAALVAMKADGTLARLMDKWQV